MEPVYIQHVVIIIAIKEPQCVCVFMSSCVHLQDGKGRVVRWFRKSLLNPCDSMHSNSFLLTSSPGRIELVVVRITKGGYYYFHQFGNGQMETQLV